MKALVIGFGKMGMLHTATLRSLSQIDRVSICETSSLLVAAWKKYGPHFTVHSDIQTALKAEKFDLAVVATPTASHFPLLQTLMQHDIHAFIEKPFVSSMDEAKTIKALHESKPHLKVMVGHCLRFSPTFQKAKSLLAENALGTITSFEGGMFSPDVLARSSGWRFKKNDKGGGVLLDLGSHLIDMTQWLLGAPAEVDGRLSSIVSEGVDDRMTSTWHYPGFTGTLEACWSRRDYRKATLELEIRGEAATLKVVDDSLTLTPARATGQAQQWNATSFHDPVPFDLAGSMYTHQMMHWVDAIQNGTSLQNNIQENCLNLGIIDTLQRAHA